MKRSILLVFLLTGFFRTPDLLAQARDVSHAFTDVTVIDVRDGVARPGITVVVSGDRISALGPSEALGGPAPRSAVHPPADLGVFTGTYQGSTPDGPLRIIIERHGDELLGGREVSELTTFRYLGDDTFTFGSGEWRLTFRRDGDATPVLLVSQFSAELYELTRTGSSSAAGGDVPDRLASSTDRIVELGAGNETLPAGSEAEFDPTSHRAGGEEQLRWLTNGYHIVIPGMGHMPTARSAACLGGLIEQFVKDPAQRPDDSCTEELPEVEFGPDLPGWAQHDPAAIHRALGVDP